LYLIGIEDGSQNTQPCVEVVLGDVADDVPSVRSNLEAHPPSRIQLQNDSTDGKELVNAFEAHEKARDKLVEVMHKTITNLEQTTEAQETAIKELQETNKT
jgi:hypothetical protein